ncbi:unnamed protein product, partial [marine sediment metagenome]
KEDYRARLHDLHYHLSTDEHTLSDKIEQKELSRRLFNNAISNIQKAKPFLELDKDKAESYLIKLRY